MYQQANSRKKRQVNVRGILFLIGILVSSVALISFSTGMNAVANVRTVTHQKTVPFRGSVATSFVITDEAPTQQVHIMGIGNTTHLGKTTFEGQVELDLSSDPATATGHGVFTAANGDTFFTNYSGESRLEDGVYVGVLEHTIQGGTGRFNGATGSFKATVANNITTRTGWQTFDGYITY